MLKKIDCVMVRVDDVAGAATYYVRVFGLRRLWTEATPARTMVGLGFPATDAELVLHDDAGIPHRVEVHYLVDDVGAAVEQLVRQGCAITVAPFAITIGRCAVVRDPFGTALCLLDMSRGPRAIDGDLGPHTRGSGE